MRKGQLQSGGPRSSLHWPLVSRHRLILSRMPSVEDYAPHAPFTLDELVVAANRILGNTPQLSIKDRTVRYYITERLLPPPSGGPKFARYGIEHLRRIVAIRGWLSEGVSLDEARNRLGGESVRDYNQKEVRRPKVKGSDIAQRTVRRIYLTKSTVLEVDTEADLSRELEAAIAEIIRLKREQGPFA